MHLDTMRDLLTDQLKDLYSAESQLVKALPKIAKRAASPALKKAIEAHLEETRHQVERLQKVGDLMGCKISGKRCKAMAGLLEEGKEAMDAEGPEEIVDAAIVAAAQRVEHYEMAGYGSARTIVELLGNEEAAALLQETLDEEKAADEKLTAVAKQDLYPQISIEDEEEMEGAGNGQSRESETTMARGR